MSTPDECYSRMNTNGLRITWQSGMRKNKFPTFLFLFIFRFKNSWICFVGSIRSFEVLASHIRMESWNWTWLWNSLCDAVLFCFAIRWDDLARLLHQLIFSILSTVATICTTASIEWRQHFSASTSDTWLDGHICMTNAVNTSHC